MNTSIVLSNSLKEEKNVDLYFDYKTNLETYKNNLYMQNNSTSNIENDTDGDGYSDQMETSYNTNLTNSSDFPVDTDEDGIPDKKSLDKKYSGDSDDDNDGINDDTEKNLGSNPKNRSDVKNITSKIDSGYLIDTNNDGKMDIFYNKSAEIQTIMEKNIDVYKIDSDGDGKWNYLYNFKTNHTERYIPEKTNNGIPWIYVGMITISLVLISAIVYLDKKGKL